MNSVSQGAHYNYSKTKYRRGSQEKRKKSSIEFGLPRAPASTLVEFYCRAIPYSPQPPLLVRREPTCLECLLLEDFFELLEYWYNISYPRARGK